MQYRIFLRLIAIPTLASSMLTMALLSNMASATEAMGVNTLESATSPTSCDLPTNSQLKSSSVHRSLGKNGQGPCWSSLQERVSPQTMKNLLQTLDAQERN